MRVDTHIHSVHSRECTPEAGDPKVILRAARRSGIDGFCISDHDTIDGYFEAKRIRQRGDPVVIPACEVSTSRGHLLVLGVERCWEKGVDPHDVVDEVRGEGGVVSAPHPFYLSRISVSWLSRELGIAVEAFNAMASVLIYPNMIAKKFAARYGLPVTAGSDSHSYEMVGWGITETDSDTVDDFISDVRRGRARIYGKKPSLGWAARFMFRSAVSTLRRLGEPKAP